MINYNYVYYFSNYIINLKSSGELIVLIGLIRSKTDDLNGFTTLRNWCLNEGPSSVTKYTVTLTKNYIFFCFSSSYFFDERSFG